MPTSARSGLRHGPVRTLAGAPLGTLVHALALLLTVVPVACGGGFVEGDMEEFGTFRIDVTNDRFPAGAQIYLEPEGAEPLDLGNAPVEGTTTFRIHPEEPDRPHRLRAEVVGADDIVSVPFVPEELSGVSWVLGTNALTPEERE